MYGGRSQAARRGDQRDRLLRAAIDVFARDGYANAGIDDIVAGAKVSRTSFYEFFATKEECLLAVIEHGMAGVFTALTQALDRRLPPVQRVEETIRSVASTLAGDPAMARVLLIVAVGATPIVEAARADARRALAAAGERALSSYGHWRNQPAHEREVVSLASMAAIAEPLSDLVASGRLADWETIVGPVSEFVGRALIPSPNP